MGALQSGEDTPQRAFLDTTIAISALYVAALQVRATLPRLSQTTNKFKTADVNSDIESETRLRRHMRQLLSANKALRVFDASARMFADLNSLQAYVDALSLHLPEMHEESFRMEALARAFLLQNSALTLTALEIGLQHLCCNHLLFVLHALEELFDPGNWPSRSL